MFKQAKNKIIISELEKDIIKTLIYSDIFKYPLNNREICERSEIHKISIKEVEQGLKSLASKGLIFHLNGFYSTFNCPDLVERRLKGNKKAKKMLKIAKLISRFISFLPFVRGVFLSGSISKNYIDKQSDIDFFIVTTPGRLWITKAIAVLIKRTLLFNSYKYFCLNYFISEDHLEIEEKNIFTATELTTLIPTFGSDIYYRLMKENKWVSYYYPNYTKVNFNGTPRSQPGFFKKLLEKVFHGKYGNWLDDHLMKLFFRRAMKRFKKTMSERQFKIAFKTKKYTSKYHEKNYQKVIQDLYDDHLNTFENKFGVTLD